jgi:hypothetical protein
MKVQDLTVGMKVTHPQYGEGIVQKISNVDASILFGNILRTVDPELAETHRNLLFRAGERVMRQGRSDKAESRSNIRWE